jgi:hypothetical protein
MTVSCQWILQAIIAAFDHRKWGGHHDPSPVVRGLWIWGGSSCTTVYPKVSGLSHNEINNKKDSLRSNTKDHGSKVAIQHTLALVKKFPAFYGTRRFITVFTRARHWSLCLARWIHSTHYHTTYLRSSLISSHLHSGPPCGLFPSEFPTKILYTFIISSMRATWPSHLTLLDFVTVIIFREIYKLWSSLFCNVLQPPATSSLLGQNILLSTLFSDTLNLCSSLSVRGKVSHPLGEKCCYVFYSFWAFSLFV